MESIPITPSIILKCSLDLEELAHSFQVGTFSKEFTPEEIDKLFMIFMKNLPPKKDLGISGTEDCETCKVDQDDGTDDDSYDSDGSD